VGAATWPVGAQVWSGQRDQIERLRAGHHISGHQPDQHQGAAAKRVQGQFHRAIFLAGRAPDRDQEVLRHNGDFIKHEQQEHVETQKHAVNTADQRQIKREKLLHPVLEVPGKQYPGHRRQSRQHHQRQADAVRGQIKLQPQRGHPGMFYDRMQLAVRTGHGSGQREPPSGQCRQQRHRPRRPPVCRIQAQQNPGPDKRDIDRPGKHSYFLMAALTPMPSPSD
jgi:hypothetical protein